ncbi:MAG: BACON domain-containing protein, partial [Bacteroidales bacterium]|nr:BACON domain-containing protein [Bacteroidales bacterium]
MKQNRYAILILAAALLAAVACRQEGSGSARATLVNPSVVEFAAKGAPETVVGVAADGAWSLRECPDWIKVSPTEGTGRADIVVSVSDNMENGEVALPRSGVVVFGGDRLLSRATLTVSQGGDRYAGTPASTLAQVPSLPDGSRAHVKNAQAVAATASAVLISDGTGFALTDGALKPGETATVKGVKGFEKGLVRLTDVDLLDVVAGTAPAPSATAVEDLDSFAGAGAFVTVTGVVGTANGAGDVALSVPGATRGVTVLSAPASLGFSAIAHHLAAVTGYAFVDGNTVCLVATDVEDKGAAMASDLLARWLFNDLTRDKLGPLFTGKAEPDGSNIYKSDNVKEEGDDGKYVPSEEGAGRLTYWSVDKRE